MSIKVMARVWEHSKQKGSALLLLIAIADYADDEGKAWPAVGTLAKKIRMSERYTQGLIGQLVKAGELRVDDQAGPHTANLYVVLSGVNPSAGVKPSSPPKPSAPRGEPQFAPGVNPASPKPPVNRQQPPPDELFDAIAEVCQVDPATAGASIGKVKKALMKADPPYTPDEVRAFGVDWWSWSGRTSAPRLWTLSEQIGKVRKQKPNNGPAPSRTPAL